MQQTAHAVDIFSILKHSRIMDSRREPVMSNRLVQSKNKIFENQLDSYKYIQSVMFTFKHVQLYLDPLGI